MIQNLEIAYKLYAIIYCIWKKITVLVHRSDQKIIT